MDLKQLAESLKLLGKISSSKGIKYKSQILEILSKKDKMTISDIQRSLKISYKETYRHVQALIIMGLLSGKKETKEKHQPVYISLRK